MSSWVNNFEKHEIWNSVDALRSELSKVHPNAEDHDNRNTVEYVTTLLETIGAYRNSTDPLLLTPKRLTVTQAQLSSLTQAVLTWKASELDDPATVDTAVLAVVDTMSTWPALRAEQEEDVVKAAISSISDATKAALDQLTSRQSELTTQQAELAKAQEALDTAASDLKDANEQMLDKLKENWKSAQAHRSNEGFKAVKELQDLRDEARRMVQDSTSLMVGTEYAEQAEARRKSAKSYDGLAVVFGVIGVATLLVYVLEGNTEDATIGSAVTRLGLALGAFVIGGFLAKRGQDQHQEARELQRTALVLSRMAPFVANLDAVAQEVLTLETADRIFTRGELGKVTEREGVLVKLQTERGRRKTADTEVDPV